MDSSDQEEDRTNEENVSAEKHENITAHPKFQGIGEEHTKIKLPLHTPIERRSPVKRKSKMAVVEDEIKRRRSTESVQNECDDENSATISNIQDALKYDKCEERLSAIAFQIKSKDETIRKRHPTKNQEKINKTKEETIETNKNISVAADQSKDNLAKKSDKHLLEHTNISSVLDRTDFLSNMKSREVIINNDDTFSEASTSGTGTLDSEKGDNSAETSKTFELSEKRDSEILEEVQKKAVKSPSKVANRDLDLSSGIPLPISQHSTSAGTSAILHDSESCKVAASEKALPRQKENIPSSPLEREKQHRCIPRISRGNQFADIEYKVRSIYAEPEPKYVSLEKMQEDAEFIQTQKQLLELFSQKRQPNRKVTSAANILGERQSVRYDNAKHLKTEISVLRSLLEFLQFHNENIRTRLRQLCKVDDSTENPVPLSHVGNQTGEISERYNPRIREYPGLASQPTKVKKDARYQKKFYKQKPVLMPTDWKVERNSSPESEPNSEENQGERIETELQIISKHKECARKESPGDEPPDLSNYDDYARSEGSKSRQENLPKAFSDAYKMCSVMAEPLTSPDSSIKLDKSNSPKANIKIKPPSTAAELPILEGLAARFMPSVDQISRSQASSLAKPSRQAYAPLKPGSQGASPLKPGSQGASPLKPGSQGASPLKPGSQGASPLKPGSQGASPLKPGSQGASPLKPGSLVASPLKSGLKGTSTEISKMIAVQYNPNFIIDSKTIFMRDLSNTFSLDSSLRHPIRLRPYLRISSYLDDQTQEFSIEEFLGMLFHIRNNYLTRDPRLQKVTFKLPLFEIPVKTNITPEDDDDDNDGGEDNIDEDEYEYELVGDNLMKPKKNKD